MTECTSGRKILLINGPNLDMLGKRDPGHYGTFTLKDVENAFRTKASELGFCAEFFQSNSEGAIIDAIHGAMGRVLGIVINAGAYTHYSFAILDAISLTRLPVMEVHISNIHEREPFRHVSVISPACVGQVCGLGLESYTIGLEKLVREHICAADGVNSNSSGSSETPGTTLDGCRRQITEIDYQIAGLLCRRMEISDAVARVKGECGGMIYDPAREDSVINSVRAMLPPGCGEAAEACWRTIMRTSRERQYELLFSQLRNQNAAAILPDSADGDLSFVRRVAFGGTAGSYSELASATMFPDAELYPAETFADACSMLFCDNAADAVVLPIANTTGGSVDTVYRLLNRNLFIARSIDVPIRHCVAGLPGAGLGDVRRVVSHPQALAQCSKIISAKGWKAETCENTSYAPSRVIQECDASLAAICSAKAAKANGLSILAADVNDTDCNMTRFIAVTRRMIVTPDASRLGLLLHLPHKNGALYSVLGVFADKSLNLASLCSQPVPDKPWEYAFFLDVCAGALDQRALSAICQLSYELPGLQIIGWYGEGPWQS